MTMTNESTNVNSERYAVLSEAKKQIVDQLITIYGTVKFTVGPPSWSKYDFGFVELSQADCMRFDAETFIEDFGFVEGQARITTPYGSAACVVKNGTLYPIITEYDQATEDNWTLRHVYLNGDNEVSDLQQMVDRSGNYLAYEVDGEDSQWSPIENYLHQHVKMPIVPKIGYIPSQDIGIGNELPGLNYTVSL